MPFAEASSQIRSYSFSHTTQTNHHHTFAWAPDLGPLQGNAHSLAGLIAADQFWEPRACSRCIGVPNWVHERSLYRN